MKTVGTWQLRSLSKSIKSIYDLPMVPINNQFTNYWSLVTILNKALTINSFLLKLIAILIFNFVHINTKCY